MTQTSAASIVHSAIEATIAALEAHGHSEDVARLSHLFSDAFARRGDSIIATLVTPKDDAGELGKAVLHMLEQKYKKHVELRQSTDPSLLGGALLTIGSERIDVSIKGALQDFERRLHSANPASL